MYLQDKTISLVPNNLVCPKCGKSHYIDKSTSYCLSVYHMPVYKDGNLVNDGGETSHTDYKFECLECGTIFDNKGTILKEGNKNNNIETIQVSSDKVNSDNILTGSKSISGTSIIPNNQYIANVDRNVILHSITAVLDLDYYTNAANNICVEINNNLYNISKNKIEQFIKDFLIEEK